MGCNPNQTAPRRKPKGDKMSQSIEEITQGIKQFPGVSDVEAVGDRIVVSFLNSDVPRYVVVRRGDWKHDLANGCGEPFFSHREAVHYAQTGQILRGNANRQIVSARESTPLDVLFAEQEARLTQERAEQAQANEMWSHLGPLHDDD